jgi:hypothetical protein
MAICKPLNLGRNLMCAGVALAEMDSDVYIAGHYSGFNGLWPGFTGCEII